MFIKDNKNKPELKDEELKQPELSEEDLDGVAGGLPGISPGGTITPGQIKDIVK